MYQQLEKIMKEKGMSKTRLAAELGLSYPAVVNKFSGRTRWKTAEKVATSFALGFGGEWEKLFGGEDEKV